MGVNKYEYRLCAIVSDADQGGANHEASAATGDEADLLTFTIPLSDTGEMPPSHFGSETALTEGLKQKASDALKGFPSAQYALVSNYNFDLIDTNCEVSGKIGFDDLLEATGLQRACTRE